MALKNPGQGGLVYSTDAGHIVPAADRAVRVQARPGAGR
jgi:hypothetical protein